MEPGATKEGSSIPSPAGSPWRSARVSNNVAVSIPVDSSPPSTHEQVVLLDGLSTESTGWSCKKKLCVGIAITIVAIVLVIAVGCSLGSCTVSAYYGYSVPGYPGCYVPNPSLVGDGKCNEGQYNRKECGWDGGDCIDSTQTCSSEHANRLQSLLTTDDWYGSNSEVSCKCPSSTDNIVLCDIAFNEVCDELNCNDGWECVNKPSSQFAAVSFCRILTQNDHWEITGTLMKKTKHTVHTNFTSGVSNIDHMDFELDTSDDDTGSNCVAFYVDDEACISCEYCKESNLVVANCSNVIEGAVDTCGGEFMKKLLVLDPK